MIAAGSDRRRHRIPRHSPVDVRESIYVFVTLEPEILRKMCSTSPIDRNGLDDLENAVTPALWQVMKRVAR
jgi:hypothetical protein